MQVIKKGVLLLNRNLDKNHIMELTLLNSDLEAVAFKIKYLRCTIKPGRMNIIALILMV